MATVCSTASDNEFKVVVVDCTDYTQSSAKNYKELSLSQVIPDDVITLFARFEILQYNRRRIYLDIDGVPITPECEDLPDRIFLAWCKWMNAYTKSNKFDDCKYVKTTNYKSTTHEGFSSHIICWNKSCSMTDLKDSLILFTNSPEGKQYAKYIDLSVYSSLRLFKLPNFIGIPMTDNDNYHRMDPRDTNKEHYIIQHDTDTEYLQFRCAVPKTLRRKAKKQIISPTNGAFYAQLFQAMDEFRQIFVEKKSKAYDDSKIDNQIKQLIEHPTVSESDKNRLRKYQPIHHEQAAMAESLVKLVCSKYGIVLKVETNDKPENKK